MPAPAPARSSSTSPPTTCSVASDRRRPYEIDDETGPLSVYGRTKLAGELAVLAAMPDAHIVRTAWVYEGADGSDFAAVMRRLAAGDGDGGRGGRPGGLADLRR